ncbi:DUF2059 domain-containing protein [Anaeromyxobacter oryzisoli]|uniref:DUF2059 domain-containing protein n=1 Tax=Anaeromyxobacter oryzisoli TaxID=2925408 RepID=UPI001F59BB1E|nr:DUF2059 domain-containing protein [Anaeromyxobacter sp. SG63]
MKRASAVLLSALLVLLAGAARAATPAKPTPLAVQLARFVLPEENWNRTMDGISRQTSQYMAQAVRQQGGTLSPELLERSMKEFTKLFTYEEIIDLQAGVLAKHYTAAELKELLAFYRTPIGQKSIRIMPEVAEDVNGQMMVIMQQRMPALMERLKPALEKAAAESSGGATQPAASERPAGKT